MYYAGFIRNSVVISEGDHARNHALCDHSAEAIELEICRNLLIVFILSENSSQGDEDGQLREHDEAMRECLHYF